MQQFVDPNRDRKTHLRAEINETINHLVADARAVAEAKGALERDTARLERLQRELNGLMALDAREDAQVAITLRGETS